MYYTLTGLHQRQSDTLNNGAETPESHILKEESLWR